MATEGKSANAVTNGPESGTSAPRPNDERYDARRVEMKWYERWEQDASLYAAETNSTRKKYYVLEMLPYPSGALHMGHVRNYSIGDALARYMWMNGYNVLHPMGWDSFGLPAENAAISNNTPPREWTLRNIANMKAQMKPRLRLRLVARSHDLLARVLSLEPMVLSEALRAGIGLPQKEQGQLVSELRHGFGKRAGRERMLLASRRHPG
jgi:hypothetical protein